MARKSESNGVAYNNHDRYFVHPAGQVYRSYQEAIKGMSEKALAALEELAARAKEELIRFREAKMATVAASAAALARVSAFSSASTSIAPL